MLLRAALEVIELLWIALENERAAHQTACEMRNDAEAENKKLRAALLWIDTFEPETTAAAEAKFGFSLPEWLRQEETMDNP